MCRDVSADGSARLSSGVSSRTRLPSAINVEFWRHNYVAYEGLGSNLDQGFLAFLGRVLSGRNRDFFPVATQSNLTALFYEDSVADIHENFRGLISAATGRWIYVFVAAPDEKITIINYRGVTDWDADLYVGGQGAWRPVQARSSDQGQYQLNRMDLAETYIIALPCQVSPDTIYNIFLGTAGPSGSTSRIMDYCRASFIGDPVEGISRVATFDPGFTISRTVECVNYYSRLMQIVDARVSPGRLSSHEAELRVRGILACLCKQLVDNDSGLENDVNMSRLNSAFTRFADYGQRKSRLIDNIYNFLMHPIMQKLEEEIMVYSQSGQRADGAAWLRTIAPLADISGEHVLLCDYFQMSSEKQPAESAWSNFMKTALGSATASESAMSTAWSGLMDLQDYIKIASGIAEVRTYHLVSQYTQRSMNWRNFNTILGEEHERLNEFVRRWRDPSAAPAMRRCLSKIGDIFSHADSLGKLKALIDGEITTGTFTAALGELAGAAERRGAKSLATRLTAISGIINLCSSIPDLAGRLQMDDYNAALGHGIVIGAGLVELGYIVATGTTLGGPIGTAVSIVGAVGAIVVVLATDSDTGIFMQHCSFGQQAGQGDIQPDWADCRVDFWTDTVTGNERQINSLLNLLHQYTIRHNFDPNTRVVAIEISTKFLPDSARFNFVGRFGTSPGSGDEIRFQVNYPSRSRSHYTSLTPRQTGSRPVTGVNTRVVTEGGSHRIEINIQVREGITSGEGWLCCYPFGHTGYSVPHEGRAFHLEQLVEHANILFNRWRDYAFESDEWGSMPT